MNRFLIVSLLVVSLALVSCAKTPAVTVSQPAEADSVAELSFTFTRQSGLANNQFAVWVEDNQGRHVKTLYATRFTANGGWRRRNMSLPQWVRQSGLANMSQTQTDAFSSATPGTGALTYRWDGTDSQNSTLPSGDYVIFLEGNHRWENRVIYRAPIRLGQGAMAAQVINEYIGDDERGRAMISSVAVRTMR